MERSFYSGIISKMRMEKGNVIYTHYSILYIVH